MINRIDETLQLIEQQIPNLNKNDINQLIENLTQIANDKRTQALDNHAVTRIDQWIPSPKTVKEAISLGVRVIDFKYCIEDFQQFALTRTWRLKDNLDAKFLVHVNIMASQSKISLDNEKF